MDRPPSEFKFETSPVTYDLALKFLLALLGRFFARWLTC